MSSRDGAAGFTLLEVMVALAILAFALVYLLEAQASSIRLAQKTRSLTLATMLAKKKLIDCKYDLMKQGMGIGDYDDEGDFKDEKIEGYTWECHAPRMQMILPNFSALQKSDNGLIKGTDQAVLETFFNLISSTLSASIRELTVIIHYGTGVDEESLKVTTLLLDRSAINRGPQ